MLPEIYLSDSEQEWENLLQEALNSKYKYYATDIIEFLEIDETEFTEALLKAEKALEVLNIPINFHIHRIYRSFETGMARDMKLSPLAVFFISIHSDPSNAHAAHLQLYLAGRYGLI